MNNEIIKEQAEHLWNILRDYCRISGEPEIIRKARQQAEADGDPALAYPIALGYAEGDLFRAAMAARDMLSGLTGESHPVIRED